MSRIIFEENRNKYSEIEKQRSSLIKIIFRNEIIVPGSYSETYIHCGCKTCHCQNEQVGHYATRISIWDKGKLYTKIVKIADREWVKRASDLYKENKKAMQEVIKLQALEKEILKTAIDLKAEKYK